MDSISKRLRFELHRNEIYEDGMNSHLSDAIESAMIEDSSETLKFLSDGLKDETIVGEKASEVLRTIGRIEDERCHKEILDILTTALQMDSYWIRDGATIGLSHLNDVMAIVPLQIAADNEREPMLKEYMLLTSQELFELGN